MISNMPCYEQMKDSGVEWLGEIPEHWEIKKLKSLARIRNGRDYKDVLAHEGYPVIGSGGEFALASHYLYKGESVLLGRKGTIDKPLYIDGAFWTVDTMYYTEVFNTTNVKFLYYCALTINFKFYATQTALPSMTQQDLSNIAFSVPAIIEQTAIATFLDQKAAQIDQAIALKQKQIELFKERKQLVIQQAVTKGLNPNAPMRDSGVEWIGEIPEHWEVKRVKNIFRLIIEPAPINNNHELLSVYTEIGVKPRKELEEKGNKASTTDGYWMVKKGDFIVNKLLAWMGAIGLSDYDGVTSPAYDILRPILDIDGRFFHLFFRTKFCTSELKKHSRGIMEMRLRLYFDKFGVIKVPFPSKSEQTAIVAHIETQSAKIDKAIDIQQQQINKLKEYKATLINSAVTGKIKVA